MAKKKEKTVEYFETKRYQIFNDGLTILGIILSILSLYIAVLVRNDTAELTKFSDKAIYYDIKLYTNDKTRESVVHDKYLSIDLTLVVDDFEVNKKNFLDVNYNSVFTRTKYFMVYDYSLENKKYKYMRYALDDKTEAKMRFEDDYYMVPVKMNYSLTPNNEYCYLLIYTETTSEKNLDLIFFKYYDDDNTFHLDTIKDDEKDKERIDIMRIDSDVIICEEYFTDLWAKEEKETSDIKFMFDVYKDLKYQLENSEIN